MAINMEDVKTLRNKTGAGFADCKKALEEANNDLDLAIKQLKEMGKAAVDKRSGRSTGEGSVFVAIKDNKAVLLELLCETDFVARNEDFQKLGNELANELLAANPSAGVVSATESMQSKMQELIATIKENMNINRITVLEKQDNEIFSSYAHGLPARLGTIVVLRANSAEALASKEAKDFAFNCSLHAVARTPLFLDLDAIDAKYKAEQLDIINTQVAQLGKPEQVASGIVKGKWNKHTTEICFTLQPWVHDEKSSAEKELSALNKSLGAELALSNFVVFTLGES